MNTTDLPIDTNQRAINVAYFIKQYGSRCFGSGSIEIDDAVRYSLELDDNRVALAYENSMFHEINLCDRRVQSTLSIEISKNGNRIINSLKSEPGGNGYGKGCSVSSAEVVEQFESAFSQMDTTLAFKNKVVQSFQNAFSQLLPWFSQLDSQKHKLSQSKFEDHILENQILLEGLRGHITISLFSRNDNPEVHANILRNSDFFKNIRNTAISLLELDLSIITDQHGIMKLVFTEAKPE